MHVEVIMVEEVETASLRNRKIAWTSSVESNQKPRAGVERSTTESGSLSTQEYERRILSGRPTRRLSYQDCMYDVRHGTRMMILWDAIRALQTAMASCTSLDSPNLSFSEIKLKKCLEYGQVSGKFVVIDFSECLRSVLRQPSNRKLAVETKPPLARNP